jgi:hypothetical protein
MKEKTAFLAKQNAVLRADLGALESELQGRRDELASLKVGWLPQVLLAAATKRTTPVLLPVVVVAFPRSAWLYGLTGGDLAGWLWRDGAAESAMQPAYPSPLCLSLPPGKARRPACGGVASQGERGLRHKPCTHCRLPGVVQRTNSQAYVRPDSAFPKQLQAVQVLISGRRERVC